MGMPREVNEEARLEYLPDARYLVYFAAVKRMLVAGRVGPTVAHVEISQAFDGDSLFGHGLSQGMGIFIGRLRATRRETRPVCKHRQASEYTCGRPIALVEASP